MACLIWGGCGASSPPDPHAGQMVYFDRTTKQPVVYRIAQEFPVVDPRTGKPTLVPASYCAQCQKWMPAPSIEVRQRNPKAALCPKGHALTLDGPWPETVLSTDAK